MINNFDNFSWDYNEHEDPYAKRSHNYFSIVDGNVENSDCYAEIVFFNQLEEALLGIVEKAKGPPVACYSSSIAISILQKEHGLSKKDARFALSQIMESDLGPSSPCFLDTSIVEN
tara:strand:+ start:4916 stop:5263 length:348 start_codon:yes stop_codon:yes gene_type:complete